MDKNTTESMAKLLEQSVRKNWNDLAMTDLGGISLQYRDVARKIAKLHILFEEAGIKPGDKIALCGKNSTHLGVALLATIAYGAVVVPLLHDFTPDSIQSLVDHSDSKLLIADHSTIEKIDAERMPSLTGILVSSDYSLSFSRNKSLEKARHHLNELFGEKYPDRFTPEDVVFYTPASPEELVLISYTSGSTGSPKGVMLPERAMWSNLRFAIDGTPYLKAGDNVVMMLPMAHMFGLVVELLLPISKGCHINFISRPPSPNVLLDAFAKVRPKQIVGVPLILEKIIRTRVFPLLEKPLMRLLMHVPFIDDKLLAKVKEQLSQAFGGNMVQFIIGGAPLNKEVETFLRRIDFPFTVGYGMTECAPLIAYAQWDSTRPGSCGKVVDRMEARVESSDPASVPGVIFVKGDNVMTGYYKNEEATASALDKEGWLNTGDMGCIDADNYVYIRGRDKNMILGPSGQNIYPEEIEQILNNLPYVNESLIVERDGKLVALVVPDFENASKQGISEEELKTIMDNNLKQLNKEIPSYSQVSKMELRHEEFEKTPKRSIRRFLYK